MILPSDNSLFARSGNEAVQINPATGTNFHITSHGSDWYWALFAVFSASALGVLGWGVFGKRPYKRLFHYLTVWSLSVLAFQYFTQASDLGWTDIQAEFNHVTTSTQTTSPGFRQIFYSRWVGYFLAFPPYLISWAALVGLPWSTALFTVAAQQTFVISLLISALIKSTYKWGYFVFGLVGLFVVLFNLWKEYLFAARTIDSEHGSSLKKNFFIINTAATIIYILYPIAFGLSEGGNVIQPDSEAAFYGVLDFVFFLLIGAFFHFSAEQVDFDARGFSQFDSKVFARSPIAYPTTFPQQQTTSQAISQDAVGEVNPEKITPVHTPEAAATHQRDSALTNTFSNETAHEQQQATLNV